MPDPIGTSGTPPGLGEDAFFILRDARGLFQRRLVEIARRSGIHAPQAIDAFAREIETAYDELAASTKRDGFEQTSGLTASRISLVGHDDLELEIRIGDLINRLKGNERIDRWRVQLRYMTLLDRPRMSAENNPAGLEPVSRALWAICRASDATLDQNLDCLERLEDELQAGLPDVYLELNTLLEKHGVAPTQVRPIQRGAGSVPQTAPQQNDAAPKNPLSALQETLRQQLADDATPNPALTGAVSAESNGTPAAGNAALNVSAQTMLNHLMERLDTLEKKHGAARTDGPSLAAAGADEPLRTLRAQDLDLPLGKPAAIALDTLSMIFDAIFATPDLPEVVKTIIGRLQIPLLKIAILDDTFFSNTQHPARQLINRMAHATLGLAQEVGRDHPTCRQLTGLANSVRSALEANDGNLAPHLTALERMIEERDQATQLKSQPYLQLVLEHEQRLQAKAHAHTWLQAVLARCTEPSIRRFLADYWLRVMQNAAGNGGPSGTPWQESRTTIEDLLWSIQPRQTPEERKRLVALVPSLLRRLNGELDALKVSTEERTPFLNRCFDLQTSALRNRPDVPAQSIEPPQSPLPQEAAPLAPAERLTPSTQVEILERDGKLVQYFGTPSAPQSARRSGNTAPHQGSWIEFRLPDDEILCGRLCGEAPDSGTLLFFNPDWGYAVALNRSDLLQQLQSGKARALRPSALFDEAAERALAQIARS